MTVGFWCKSLGARCENHCSHTVPVMQVLTMRRDLADVVCKDAWRVALKSVCFWNINAFCYRRMVVGMFTRHSASRVTDVVGCLLTFD
jgi:hypothetical protein